MDEIARAPLESQATVSHKANEMFLDRKQMEELCRLSMLLTGILSNSMILFPGMSSIPTSTTCQILISIVPDQVRKIKAPELF